MPLPVPCRHESSFPLCHVPHWRESGFFFLKEHWATFEQQKHWHKGRLYHDVSLKATTSGGFSSEASSQNVEQQLLEWYHYNTELCKIKFKTAKIPIITNKMLSPIWSRIYTLNKAESSQVLKNQDIQEPWAISGHYSESFGLCPDSI